MSGIVLGGVWDRWKRSDTNVPIVAGAAGVAEEAAARIGWDWAVGQEVNICLAK